MNEQYKILANWDILLVLIKQLIINNSFIKDIPENLTTLVTSEEHIKENLVHVLSS